MKIAVLSDVHGNLPALLKVLEDAKKRKTGRFIIAGDYCLSGAWPDECIETLKKLDCKHIIRGNEERYLEDLIGKDQSNWTDGQMQISYWNYRNIKTENLAYIFSLPTVLDLELSGVRLHVAHYSNAFIGDYELEKIGSAILAGKYAKTDVTPDILKEDIQTILENDPVFQRKITALEDGVYIFGHSHVQWSYKDKDRDLLLINPGSCGLPLDGIKNSIPYSVINISEDGHIGSEEIRLPFDKTEYVERLKKTTQYTEANVWSKVIVKELLTAREQLAFFLPFTEQYANKIGDPVRPFCVDTWEKAYEEWKKQDEHFR